MDNITKTRAPARTYTPRPKKEDFVSCGKCKDLAMGICRKLNTKLTYDEVHYEWAAICAMHNYTPPTGYKPRPKREREEY